MKPFLHLLLATLLLLTACGSNHDEESFTQEEKHFLHNLFLTEYLWYDSVAETVDYGVFDTPQSMIDSLKVNPPDLWSGMMTKQQYEDFSNQVTAGFGFGYTDDFRLYLVRIGAPAYQKLFRGDKILEINGETVTVERIRASGANLGVATTFKVLRGAGEVNVTMTPDTYSFKVSEGKVLMHEGKKVGYLRFDSFTGSSVAEFEKIFTRFQSEAIDELVIDLRYNGGGSLTTASALLDNITNAHAQERQVYLDWNRHYQVRNTAYYFEEEDFQDGNELAMNRVLFLVTANSASASEAVVSSPIPYLGQENVITIGTETHGKPVGMTGRAYLENYYFLINFFVKNDAGDSSSFEGIPATCTATDDLTHLRGDTNESMLKTALEYISTGRC